MAVCEHISWLDVSERDQITLLDSGVWSRVSRYLVDPDNQRPSLIFLVGRKAKASALRDLFPFNNIKRGPKDGMASLRVDNATLSTTFPLLFADSDPFAVSLPALSVVGCHTTTQFPTQWTIPATESLFDIIHARLFFLFSDVLCLFADDFRSFYDVVDRIRIWATLGSSCGTFPQVRPKVVIVRHGNSPTANQTQGFLQATALEGIECDSWQDELYSAFSSITVLYLGNGEISSSARHRRLKDTLQRQGDEMRHVRQTFGCLYTASHLTRIYLEALRHVATTKELPFDVVSAARHDMPPQTDYVDHMLNFFSLRPKELAYGRATVAHVASSILLDAYPPNMHRMYP